VLHLHALLLVLMQRHKHVPAATTAQRGSGAARGEYDRQQQLQQQLQQQMAAR
jgi:hypothetical protein